LAAADLVTALEALRPAAARQPRGALLTAGEAGLMSSVVPILLVTLAAAL